VKIEIKEYEKGLPNNTKLTPAILLAWGSNFEELRDGVGQYPVGICQMPDGQIRIVHCELIRVVR
jgi:hypothetical protein